MACLKTQDGLVSMIEALARYREEGRELFPEVYVFDDLTAVIRALPGSEYVNSGSGRATQERWPKRSSNVLRLRKRVPCH